MNEENDNEQTSMFSVVEEVYSWVIVRHKETNVMYAVSDGYHNRGVFTLLVNADGTPMVWKGDE